MLGNPESDPEARQRELPCYSPFADFLATELMPWIHTHYHVIRDPAQTVVGGTSYGGLAAAYAGWRYPNLFGNILSQSGAFWWMPDWSDLDKDAEPEWLAHQFAKGSRLPLRFYLEVGRFETGRAPAKIKSSDQLAANRHLRNVLEAKGYQVHYAEYVGGHDIICWRGTLADGLVGLIGNDGNQKRTSANSIL